MTVKQVASFHAPLKREDTSVKTTEQHAGNEQTPCKAHKSYVQLLVIYVREYRINPLTAE